MNYEETYRNFDEEYKNLYAAAQTGMTLRDYFAAKALQGICARGPEPSWTHARSAAEAYDLANAMMKARNSIWQNAITKEGEA